MKNLYLLAHGLGPSRNGCWVRSLQISAHLSDVSDMSLANTLFCTRKNKHLLAPTWEQAVMSDPASEVSLCAAEMTQIHKLSTEKYDRKIFVTDYSSNKNISEGE